MKKILLFTLFCTLFVACKDKNTSVNGFDRKKMLSDYAENVIKPAYSSLLSSVNTLKTASITFSQTPNTANLEALQTAWINTYGTWQSANSFNFGPAGEQGTRKGLIEEIGTFPVSIAKIDTAIARNNANFNDFNRDARGFLAIEYLIFRLDNDNSAIVSAFQNSENRKNFLLNAVKDIEKRVAEVNTAWQTGGYATDFINNDGTDVGSSTSQLYNEWVRSFEALKNFKVGLPLGKRPGQTKSEPQLVEAYYSGTSREMAEKHFSSIEYIYYCTTTRTNETLLGFADYLATVEGGKALVTSTQTQTVAVKNAINAVPKSPVMSIQIQNTPAPIENLHTELQKNTRFFKSDMSSLLGIAITFSSGDGD